ncbi:MAG: 50S ribosomal protein L21 [Actinomycetota bacterium]
MVLETGGKQYKVKLGETFLIEKIEGEKGDKVIFSNIKLISEKEEIIVDKDMLSNYRAIGEIVEHISGKKIIAFKHTSKTGYKRKIGHRQKYSRVVLKEIKSPKSKKE